MEENLENDKIIFAYCALYNVEAIKKDTRSNN